MNKNSSIKHVKIYIIVYHNHKHIIPFKIKLRFILNAVAVNRKT
jgi:hypothetical protein